MGTKRIGLARVEALIENLKRQINLSSPLRKLSGEAGTQGDTSFVIGKLAGGDVTADPFTESATQLFPLGTKMIYGDRTYRYAFSGEANNAGVLLEGSVLVHANHRDVAVQAAAAAGASTVYLTIATTAVTANLYDDGYLHINDDTNNANSQGKLWRIKSHGTGTGTIEFVLYDKVPVLLPTTAKADLIKNVYTDVLKCATTGVSATLGVTPIEIANDRYFWIQTGGPASVLVADAVLVLGQPAVRNFGTAGSARAIDSDSDTLSGQIGTCIVTNGAGDQGVVFLNLDV